MSLRILSVTTKKNPDYYVTNMCSMTDSRRTLDAFYEQSWILQEFYLELTDKYVLKRLKTN